MELASLGLDLRINGVSLVCGSMAGLWCLICLKMSRLYLWTWLCLWAHEWSCVFIEPWFDWLKWAWLCACMGWIELIVKLAISNVVWARKMLVSYCVHRPRVTGKLNGMWLLIMRVNKWLCVAWHMRVWKLCRPEAYTSMRDDARYYRKTANLRHVLQCGLRSSW